MDIDNGFSISTIGPTLDDTAPSPCGWCSNGTTKVYHTGGPCPRIKAIEYNVNGTVKRVEFHE